MNMNRLFYISLILFSWLMITETLWVQQAQATAPNWKILVLIYDKTDFNYIDGNGIQRHVVAALTPEQRDHAAHQARQFFEHDVPALNSGNMFPEVSIRFPDRVLTELETCGDGYSAGPTITVPDIDPDFDSVFVIWEPHGIDQATWESIYLGCAGGLAWPRGTGQTYAWAAYGMMEDHRMEQRHGNRDQPAPCDRQ